MKLLRKLIDNNFPVYSDNFLEVDLSFLPKEIIPIDLEKQAKQKMIYNNPNEEDDEWLKIISEVPLKDASTILMKNREYQSNYYSFTLSLSNLGRELLKNKEFELAEKCFRYLEKLESNLSYEGLIKINIMKDDERNLKYIFDKIKKGKQPLHYSLLTEYGDSIYSYDEILEYLHKEAMEENDFNICSHLYRDIAFVTLKKGDKKEAVKCFIVSFINAALYDYNTGSWTNIDSFVNYKSIDKIKASVSWSLKKANYKASIDEISCLLQNLLSHFPNPNMKEFVDNLSEILKDSEKSDS
jgi:hypothetical protein